jgi:hypothetical protein
MKLSLQLTLSENLVSKVNLLSVLIKLLIRFLHPLPTRPACAPVRLG